MARKVTSRVRRTLTRLAKQGAGRAQSVAAEALGAAAGAAAEVVVKSAAAGLKSRATDLEQARPRLKRNARSAAAKTIEARPRTRGSKRKRARVKRTRR